MDMTDSLPCSGGNVAVPNTGIGSCTEVKVEDETINVLPPALPPRPPPRSRNTGDPSSPCETSTKRTRKLS